MLPLIRFNSKDLLITSVAPQNLVLGKLLFFLHVIFLTLCTSKILITKNGKKIDFHLKIELNGNTLTKKSVNNTLTKKSVKYLSIKIDKSLTWNVHITDNGIKINRYITILANSANTKCHPFHVKINCSKLRIDRLQQLCHVIVLIYLFVSSRNYYCLVYFCQGKLLQFQANVTEAYFSQ